MNPDLDVKATKLNHLGNLDETIYRREAIGSKVKLPAKTKEEAEQCAHRLIAWVESANANWYVRQDFDTQTWELCYIRHFPVLPQPIDFDDLNRLGSK